MSDFQFLLLVPGIIYGVGVVDLIKVTFRLNYWEIYLWAAILFLAFILQWYSLYDTMAEAAEDKLLFTIMMLSPLVFTRGCYLLTPTEDVDTKAYFLKYRGAFFVNMVFIILINSGLQYFLIDNSDARIWSRLLFLPFMIVACFWDNKWYRLSIGLLFFMVYSRFFFL